MALILTEEQELLRDSAQGFVAGRTSVGQLRELRGVASGPGHDETLWREMVDLGWAAIPFAEDVGGLGLGFAELGVVLEQLGKGLVTSPLLSSVVLGGGAVDLAGNEDQRKALLPGVCDGTGLLALAHQETPRHAPYTVATTANREGDEYVVSGRKVLVLGGEAAAHLIVVARSSGAATDRDGLSLFRVSPTAAGVTCKRNVLLDSRVTINLELNGVRVANADLLGVEGGAADVLDRLFDRAAIAVSAELLGSIQETFDRTVEYLKEREQFQVKIGTFQGLKHRAARWFCEVELARSIVMDALRAIDEDREGLAAIASACKARASDTARLAGKEGIQMHGGIGVTDEHEIGLFMKRGRVGEMLFGEALFHRERFATLNGY